MENRINQVITLENGKKYFILKQAVYKKENYFVTAEVTDDEKDLKDNFLVFHKTMENGTDYVHIENDPKVLEVILKWAMEDDEENEQIIIINE